jgi:hypothetical protein
LFPFCSLRFFCFRFVSFSSPALTVRYSLSSLLSFSAAKQSKAKQSKANQSKAKQSKAKQSKAKQSKAKQMASASSSPPSSAAAVAVLGSLDLVIAITSNLSCRDLRFAAAAVSIADDSVEPVPRLCKMCVPGGANSCRKAGACKRRRRLKGLRGRVNALLGEQPPPSIVSLLRGIHTESGCAKCGSPGVNVCECSKEDCGCGKVGSENSCFRSARSATARTAASTGRKAAASPSASHAGPATKSATRAALATNAPCATVSTGTECAARSCVSCDTVICSTGCTARDIQYTPPPNCSVCGTWSCCKKGCASTMCRYGGENNVCRACVVARWAQDAAAAAAAAGQQQQ